MPKKSFHFEFYSVHGHVDDKPVDYLKLLVKLVRLRGYHSESGDYHRYVGQASLSGEQLFLVIYTGHSEKSTLFFDLTAKAELTESISPGRFQARKTHAMIDAGKRVLAIEARKGGLSAFSLSALIEEFLRTDAEFKSLELSFNPIADEEFAARIDEFSRIRSATITIARPNVDWTDRHAQLTDVAKESDAKALDVTARAKRGGGLSKQRGIIEFIKSSASSAKSMFKKIKIIGSIGTEPGLITLDLSKHVQHLDVALETSAETNLPSESDVRARLSAHLTNIPAESGDH
jgi:hypothetical protein